MSFVRFNLVTDDDLHASLVCVPHSVSLPCDTEDSSSSGETLGLVGAAAGFDQVHQEALTAERTLPARTASAGGEGR